MPAKKKTAPKVKKTTKVTATIFSDTEQGKNVKFEKDLSNARIRKCVYGGKLMSRWEAALNFHIESLYDPTKEPLTITQTLLECRDDDGNKIFPESTARHNQHILTGMLNSWMGENLVPSRSQVNFMIIERLDPEYKNKDDKYLTEEQWGANIDRYIKINGIEPGKVIRGQVDEEVGIAELTDPEKFLLAIAQVEKEKNGHGGKAALRNRVRDLGLST